MLLLVGDNVSFVKDGIIYGGTIMGLDDSKGYYEIAILGRDEVIHLTDDDVDIIE